jgi:mono/diheme cytochrome c family protein
VSKLKLAAGIVAVGLLASVGASGAGISWVWSAAQSAQDTTYTAHAGDFPVPFPLSQAELDELAAAGEPFEAGAVATQRAVERGKHLVEARYACIECHGVDFGGGSMIDDPAIGKVLGPNLTLGQGGVTASYQPADWDRKVRHGVRPDGRSGFMPSEDYLLMSDRELSDIIAYIRSVPPVDRQMPAVEMGPLGTVLVATGQLQVAAVRLPRYDQHLVEPPPAEPTVAFGQHLMSVCTGCHRANFEGGPMVGGPPDWLPAANLSPGEAGLAAWTYEDFAKVMRSGIRPDGSPVGMPMVMIIKYGSRMTETELQAMWAYLRTVAPVADGA